jgi:hypothetical protein
MKNYNNVLSHLFKFIFISLCFFFNPIYAQKTEPCICLEEFHFLQNYIGTNHAAFGDNVNDANRDMYESHVQEIKSAISKDPIEDHCIIYLRQYLKFFKDNHTQINDPGYSFDESDEAAFQDFLNSSRFQNRERVNLDLVALEQTLNAAGSNEIEGIYQSSDGSYKVALVKNQNNFRDYYGIILDSKTKLWQSGQVKFELKQTGDSSYKGYFYYKYYGLNIEEVIYDRGNLGSWVKVGLESARNESQPTMGNQAFEPFAFKKISDDTGYLSIKTFEGFFKSKFDSTLQANQEEILRLPKLIIDVRGNGGGSDALLSVLMPLIYTDTIYNELPQLFVTEDNFRIYHDFLNVMLPDSLKYGSETISYLRKLVDKLEHSPKGAFVPMFDNLDDLGKETMVSLGGENYTFTNYMGEDKHYMLTYANFGDLPIDPYKIVLLMDRGCASTCENLILMAMQSHKVTTMGQNSGGYKGYGNVFPVRTPWGYQLNMSTTRYEELSKYEFVGIAPQVYIQDNEDWIKRAIEILEEN